MILKNVRITSVVLGVLILLVQGINAASGRGLHAFLVADLIVAPWLILAGLNRRPQVASVSMLAAFAATGGVLFAATTGKMLMGGFDSRTALAAIGILPCLVCGPWLAQQILLADRA